MHGLCGEVAWRGGEREGDGGTGEGLAADEFADPFASGLQPRAGEQGLAAEPEEEGRSMGAPFELIR